MVKVLQKKFIVTAMAAVSVLLFVLIGAINTANCWITGSQTDQQLKLLGDTQVQILKHEKPDAGRRKPEFADPPGRGGGKRSFFNPPIDEDMAMSLRFFFVCLDEENNAVRKDVSRIASVDEKEAEQYAKQAVQKSKHSGYLEHFKYQVLAVEEDDGSSLTAVLFLDISRQFRSIAMVFVLSVSIAAACWLCMLFLVMLLSKRAIRPIAENMQKQRQFVTDAGHEIKTPLAIIQANIDAMELISGENKWSRNIRSQTVRLNGLMQNLLTLARMDEGGFKLAMAEVSFGALVKESIQPFYESAVLKEIQIEADIAPEVRITANSDSIRQLLSILFDNALKYTNQGGRIMISLLAEGGTAVLKVQNSCEKLPENDAETLFDRFSRGDSARTQKNGGYGIGLSAACAVVKAHHGHISAKYQDKNTILFTVIINRS